MRSLTRSVAVVGVCVAVALAISCGGGGGSDFVYPMQGQVDFAANPGKALLAPDDLVEMTVEVRNIKSGDVTEATVAGSRFMVYVTSGDYEVVAQNADGGTVRKISVDFNGVNNNVGTVDVHSTAAFVMTYLSLVEPDESVASLHYVPKLDDTAALMERYVVRGDEVLLGDIEGSAEIALFALGTLEAVRDAVAAGVDLTDEEGDTFLTMGDVGLFYDDVVEAVLTDNPGGTVTVGDRTITDPADVPDDLSTLVGLDEIIDGIDEAFTGAGDETVQLAVVATIASDWSSGSVSTVSTTGERTATNNLLPSNTSDHTVTSHAGSVYVIRRYEADNVIKLDGASVGAESVVYQRTTLDADEIGTSNPQWLAFASESKAYLSRFEYNTLWIIDPSAGLDEDWKIGEIDLEGYADGDGVVEMTKMVVVNGKVYLLLQRLDRADVWNWIPNNIAYIAVMDTETDALVDVDVDTAGVQMIELLTRNPLEIAYVPETGLIYVQSTGRWPGFGTDAEYTGGIETVDPVTYDTVLLVDDDDDGGGTAAYGGNISGMAIASATRGYLTTYAGWGDNSIRTFNPTTGVVGEVVTGLANLNIRGMAVDEQGYLWVLDATAMAPGIRVFDTVTDTQTGSLIDLGGLCPEAITFVDVSP